jgi:hypothetical protein
MEMSKTKIGICILFISGILAVSAGTVIASYWEPSQRFDFEEPFGNSILTPIIYYPNTVRGLQIVAARALKYYISPLTRKLPTTFSDNCEVIGRCLGQLLDPRESQK